MGDVEVLSEGASTEATLIRVSVAFIKAVNDVYGTEKGAEIWESLADFTADDLKFKVFSAMLSGGISLAGAVITVSGPTSVEAYRKIDCIKAIRRYGGLDLKAAKKASEVMIYEYKSIRFPLSEAAVDANVNVQQIQGDFARCGFLVTIT